MRYRPLPHAPGPLRPRSFATRKASATFCRMVSRHNPGSGFNSPTRLKRWKRLPHPRAMQCTAAPWQTKWWHPLQETTGSCNVVIWNSIRPTGFSRYPSDMVILPYTKFPPNGQGLAALIMLGILGHCNIKQYALDSVDSVHLQVEAMKLAFCRCLPVHR